MVQLLRGLPIWPGWTYFILNLWDRDFWPEICAVSCRSVRIYYMTRPLSEIALRSQVRLASTCSFQAAPDAFLILISQQRHQGHRLWWFLHGKCSWKILLGHNIAAEKSQQIRKNEGVKLDRPKNMLQITTLLELLALLKKDMFSCNPLFLLPCL